MSLSMKWLLKNLMNIIHLWEVQLHLWMKPVFGTLYILK